MGDVTQPSHCQPLAKTLRFFLAKSVALGIGRGFSSRTQSGVFGLRRRGIKARHAAWHRACGMMAPRSSTMYVVCLARALQAPAWGWGVSPLPWQGDDLSEAPAWKATREGVDKRIFEMSNRRALDQHSVNIAPRWISTATTWLQDSRLQM